MALYEWFILCISIIRGAAAKLFCLFNLKRCDFNAFICIIYKYNIYPCLNQELGGLGAEDWGVAGACAFRPGPTRHHWQHLIPYTSQGGMHFKPCLSLSFFRIFNLRYLPYNTICNTIRVNRSRTKILGKLAVMDSFKNADFLINLDV